MFTGIIQSVGEIRSVEQCGHDALYVIATGGLDMSDVRLGDSIAVQGVCLTVIERGDNFYAADVSSETLSRTTLGRLEAGSAVNLEKAVTPTTRLGGHMVSGHVDATGEVINRASEGRCERFVIEAPDALARYIAGKGSICVDGVSLTINDIRGAQCDLNIVPHTLKVTTLGALQVGDFVNLEVDIVARYLERLMLGGDAATDGVSKNSSRKNGCA